MIGILENKKNKRIFEFKDESELSRALNNYGSQSGCNVLFITDVQDKIKGVVINGSFTFNPDIRDNEKYLIYGSPNAKGKDAQRNDYLLDMPNWEILRATFAYIIAPVPTEIPQF